MLKMYADATKELAEKKKLGIEDLLARSISYRANCKPPFIPWTENGLHLTESGYTTSAPHSVVIPLPNDDLKPDPVGAKPTVLPPVSNDNKTEDIEQLRDAIIAKNRLYFDRWRPQNQTYLFGFRKKEQGQNAKEIAEFDPLIEKAEKDIAELRKKFK